MTSDQYIDLYHAVSAPQFCDTVWPYLVNGEWTIDGKAYYPCIILDNKEPEQPDNTYYIVTRNQTFMHVTATHIRRIPHQPLPLQHLNAIPHECIQFFNFTK